MRKSMAKYPRFRSAKKMGPGAKCQFCESASTHRVLIEMNFMRGDDESFRVCTEHLKTAQRSAKLLLQEYEI